MGRCRRSRPRRPRCRRRRLIRWRRVPANRRRGKRRLRGARSGSADRYRRAQAVLTARHAANVRRRKDKRKEDTKIRIALGDPMAPFGLDKLKTYRPLYNVQTMSDVHTDLVLAYATTRTIADNGQLLSMIERTMEVTDRLLKELLVDSGYPSGEDLAHCAEMGVIVYAPWNENTFTESKRAKGSKGAQIPKDRFAFDQSTSGLPLPGRQAVDLSRTDDETESQWGLLHDRNLPG